MFANPVFITPGRYVFVKIYQSKGRSHTFLNKFIFARLMKKKKKRVDFYLLNAKLNHNCMHGYTSFLC